jgi:RNA polymerase sigma-70 factor (ECF subfamily)
MKAAARQPEQIGRREDVLRAVEAYESRLTRYALRLLGDVALAQDAVQHTFVQLCDEPPRQPDGLAAWLFTVCRNKAYDFLRRAQRDEALEGHPVGDLLTSREPDPAEAAASGDLQVWIRAQMTHLPVMQREALTLWSEGFAYREIAAITGRTEGNVRVVVHRALNTLRNLAPAEQAW